MMRQEVYSNRSSEPIIGPERLSVLNLSGKPTDLTIFLRIKLRDRLLYEECRLFFPKLFGGTGMGWLCFKELSARLKGATISPGNRGRQNDE